MSAVIVLLFLCLSARANELSNFTGWHSTPWVIPNVGPVINLPCTDSSYYPFNYITGTNVTQVQWILPEAVSFIHLKPGNTAEGWAVGPKENDFLLTITRSNLNEPKAIIGQYTCAALATYFNASNKDPLQETNVKAWYYLRWGVGLYSDVPAMQAGGIERYTHQFTIAGVALLVYIVIAVGLILTCEFRYKGVPKYEFDESASSNSKSNVYVDDSSDKKKDEDYIY